MYLSIDIETTGLNADTCQILEFAAVLETGKGPVEELPGFSTFVRPPGLIQGEAFALQMNASILKALCQKDCQAIHPNDLVAVLTCWAVAQGIDPQKITVAGKNFASFDSRFLSKLPGWGTVFKPRHRVIDPAMLYWNASEDGDTLPDTATCMKRAGIEGVVSHRAEDDARCVIELVRRRAGKLTG